MRVSKISELEEREKLFFNKMADRYDRNHGYKRKFVKYKIRKKIKVLTKFAKDLKKKEDVKILDIGCGTGEYTKLLSKAFPKAQIIGLDISPKMIALAKVKCKNCKNVKFEVGTAYNIKKSRNSFDLVCGFYVLHHLEIKPVVREVERIIKPGGFVFFCEPNILNPVVYLIKSSKKLKEMVGDSTDEWAVNPLKIAKQFNSLKIKFLYREFVFPLGFNYKIKLVLDKLSRIFEDMPLLKFLAGTVIVVGKKE